MIICREAQNQFGVVEIVHQLYLFTGSLPLLSTSAFVELPSAHTSCLFVGELEHLAELSPNEETSLVIFNSGLSNLHWCLSVFILPLLYLAGLPIFQTTHANERRDIFS